MAMSHRPKRKADEMDSIETSFGAGDGSDLPTINPQKKRKKVHTLSLDSTLSGSPGAALMTSTPAPNRHLLTPGGDASVIESMDTSMENSDSIVKKKKKKKKHSVKDEDESMDVSVPVETEHNVSKEKKHKKHKHRKHESDKSGDGQSHKDNSDIHSDTEDSGIAVNAPFIAPTPVVKKDSSVLENDSEGSTKKKKKKHKVKKENDDLNASVSTSSIGNDSADLSVTDSSLSGKKKKKHKKHKKVHSDGSQEY